MAFGPPVIVSPFSGQSFSTNQPEATLVLKVTDDTASIYINNIDVSGDVVAVSEDNFDVFSDDVLTTSDTAHFVVQVPLTPNVANDIEVKVINPGNLEHTISVEITNIPASSVGVTVYGPTELITDSRDESVLLTWTDNNSILESPEGSGYNIYVSTAKDKRPGTYHKVNTNPISDTSDSELIKTTLSEISVSGETTTEYAESTVGSTQKSTQVSGGLKGTRYFIIDREDLGTDASDLDTLKATMKSDAQTELTDVITPYLTFQHADGSAVDITVEAEVSAYLTALNTKLTGETSDNVSQHTHDAGLMVNKYPNLSPLYTYRKTDLDISDLDDVNIQDYIKNANMILDIYPDLSIYYTYGVMAEVPNPYGFWLVQTEFVSSGPFVGKYFKNTRTFVTEESVTDTYGVFAKSEEVLTQYPSYEYRYIVTKAINTITKTEESDPELKLKHTISASNLPSGLSFLVGEPLFFRVSFEYRNIVSQVVVESSLSPETVGVPITLSNSLVTLQQPSPIEIQNVLITGINSSLPDLDVKPGSVARSVFINPISTAHQTLHFKEYFRDVSQSFTKLLEFDGTDDSGNSIEVSKSANKQSLRDAYGLEDTPSNNQLVQDFVDNRFDLLASNYGVSREEDTFSEGSVLFKATSLVGEDNTVQINAGGVVATGSPETEFLVLNTLTKASFTSFKDEDGFHTASVNIRAVESGVSGNVPAGSVSVVKGSSNINLSVTNLASTYGGKDRANNRELVEKVQAKQFSVDTGTPKGILRSVAESGLAKKVKVIRSGNPFMKRGFDYVAGEYRGGYVDVYVKGKFPKNSSETFGVFYEKQKGIIVNFKINSAGEDPFDFGAPYAVLDFLPDNPGFEDDYLDIYDITKAEIVNPPGDTFLSITSLFKGSSTSPDLTTSIKTDNYKIALDLTVSDVKFEGETTTSITNTTLRYTFTGDVTDYSKYKNKVVKVAGFTDTNNNIDPHDILGSSPIKITGSGVGYVEIEDPGGSVETAGSSAVEMSGNLDLYLFTTASPISFDVLMRKDFYHRVRKNPLDTITSLIDSNNVSYKENLNYVSFNNSRTLLEGGSILEDSGVQLIASPLETPKEVTIEEADLTNDKLYPLSDCWLTSMPILETVSGDLVEYTYQNDFTRHKNSKFLFIRLDIGFELEEGQSSVRLKVKYGKNRELSREIVFIPGLDTYVDLVKYYYFPVITEGSNTLLEGDDYELLASDKNSVYIRLKSYSLTDPDTLDITYYENTDIGSPDNFNDPVLTGDDYRLSLAPGVPKVLSHFGIEPTSVVVRPYNDLDILLEPFLLDQDYRLVIVPDTEIGIERIKGGNIRDTTFVNVEYSYADEVIVNYIYDEQVSQLTEHLSEFSHGGSNLLVKKLQDIKIDIKAFIYLYDLNIKGTVDQKIREGIYSYVDKLDVGDSLFESDIVRIIDATSGVRNVKVDLAQMAIADGEVSYAEIIDRSYFAIYEQGAVNSYFSPSKITGPDGTSSTLLKYTPQENGGTLDKEKSIIVDNVSYTLVDSPVDVSKEKGLAHISSNGSVYVSFVDEVSTSLVIEITYQAQKTEISTSIEVSPFQLIGINNLEFVYLQQ